LVFILRFLMYILNLASQINISFFNHVLYVQCEESLGNSFGALSHTASPDVLGNNCLLHLCNYAFGTKNQDLHCQSERTISPLLVQKTLVLV